MRSKLFSRLRFWGGIEIDNHATTTERNLADDAEEYGAREKLKVIPAQITVSSNQVFLVNSPIMSRSDGSPAPMAGKIVMPKVQAAEKRDQGFGSYPRRGFV